MNKTSDPSVEAFKIARPDITITSQGSLGSSASLVTSSEQAVPKGNKSATRSLMLDLKQIQANPLPLVAAHPLEGDIFCWHGNLVGPENTPYAGGIFHIELKFPKTYPLDSPSATILSPLPHPHVRNGKICMDILSDYESYFKNIQDGSKSVGWSSAYSVQTLLLQLQGKSHYKGDYI
jgi:ubiquitin-protein ligase